MKKLLCTLAALAVSTAAWAVAEPDSVATDTVKGYVFTDIKTVPTTSVKDQNRSGTCWCFAGTSFFEDEIMRRGGDSLDMSEMYTVRQCYLDKADRFVRLYGQTNFVPGGGLTDVSYVWKRYGAVPETAYPGLSYGEDKHVHNELQAVLAAYLNALVSKPNKRLSTAWRKGVEGILDAYLGPVPETFTVGGKTYTPQSYAAALGIVPDDYMALTSYTHHPFYEAFVLEVPDNWLSDRYMNLPLDELKAVIDNALENGYPVLWGADVSEGGFKWYEGVAVMPVPKDKATMDDSELARWVKLSDKDRESARYDLSKPVEEIVVTQEMRQDMFDRQETTDDHAMEIVGIATDQNGNRFYKVKNSWDTNQVYDGFFYVSEPFMLAKTMSILVHKDAVPKAIAKKLRK